MLVRQSSSPSDSGIPKPIVSILLPWAFANVRPSYPHMVGAGLAELVGTFILVYGGHPRDGRRRQVPLEVRPGLRRGAAGGGGAGGVRHLDHLRRSGQGEAKLAATYPAQGVGDLQAFVVEVFITFVLVFVVMAVATDDRAPAAIAPIAVGFALAVGVFIAGPVTGGSVNPARSLGPMIVATDLTSVWLYVLGPIVGGVLAAFLYDRTMAQTEAPG